MFCNRKTICSIIVWQICFFNFNGIKAQSVTQVPVDLEIREHSVNDQITSYIVKITNSSEEVFNGFLQLDAPPELRSLSQSERAVFVAPADSSFVAYKLLAGRDIGAGRKTIRYSLFNEKKEKVLSRETYIDIEEREQIYLLAENTPVMVIHPEDSVRIQVTVNNSGNTHEEVTLVFNVPNLRGAPAFTELKETVAPMEQREFTHSFIPSGNLLSSGQFSVHITAMKGREKTLFGNRTVTVQNVSTDRSYRDINPVRSSFPEQGSVDNSITLSYRQYNSSSSMLQLQGGGYMNLPAGYLYLKGNVYKYNSLHTPMVTNTSLMYKLYENEFTIGNLSEQTELPLFGRGAKAMFSDEKKSRTLTFGAIDQNFNLAGPQPWFSDYYSFYVQGEVGANNYNKGTKATYIYQKNPYEKATYNVAGLQWKTVFGAGWSIDMKGYGALGSYETVPGSKFSGAVEFRYSGKLFSDLTLNGSGYYSDGYFPGSRKGTTSFSQGINKKLSDDIFISGSVSYNKTSPKSYAYAYTYQSENSYGNVTLSLPRLSRLSSSVYYRYQGESSPSYASYLDGEAVSGNIRMRSHLWGWQWRWQSPNSEHSLYGALDGGFFTNPLKSGRLSQAKTTLNYSYQWLTFSTSYQKGAYYLYEYIMAKQSNKNFSRFTASASINKNIAKKISLSSGFNFSEDVYQGSVPSANLTAAYSPKENVAFFLNAYWYKYRFINTSNIFNVQVGVTYNFSKIQPLSGKKSNVTAQVYYDHNANSRYDDGDEPAGDYLLNIDEKAFISNKDGKVRYSLVPYGEYSLKPMQTGRWFFDQTKITVNSSKTKIDIPLKQSGTLRGSIRYIAGRHSVEIIPRYEGLRFTITNADKTVTQTVVTDSEGEFLTFLPVGEYTITLDKKTLVEHTDCKEAVRTFKIEAGNATKLDVFDIEIKSRQVNITRFLQ
jgi:hypothetical protein